MLTLHAHLDKVEFGFRYERKEIWASFGLTSPDVDNEFVTALAKVLLCSESRPKYKFRKTPDVSGDGERFQHYRRFTSWEGSVLDVFFAPRKRRYVDPVTHERKTGEYAFKAKLRITKTKIADLLHLEEFFRKCYLVGAHSLKHSLQCVEFAVDFFPDLPSDSPGTDSEKAYTDLLTLLNSRFVMSGVKNTFYSTARGHRSSVSVGEYMPSIATYYQNYRKDRYKQAKVYWKDDRVRLELTFFPKKLNAKGLKTIRDLLQFDLVSLVRPTGRGMPEIRFLIPVVERFRTNWLTHLDGSPGGRAVKEAYFCRGNLFLAQLVGKVSEGGRPHNLWRDYFEQDHELTEFVLHALEEEQNEFRSTLKRIDEIP